VGSASSHARPAIAHRKVTPLAPFVGVVTLAGLALVVLAADTAHSLSRLGVPSDQVLADVAVALGLMIIGQVWVALPGRLGDIPTQGWSTSVSVAVVFVAGPLAAVLCACIAALAGLIVDRRRSERRAARAIADVGSLLVGGLLMVITGSGGVPPQSLSEAGTIGVFRAALVVVGVFAAHITLMSLLDAVGRAGTIRGTLIERLRTTGVAIGALILLGPGIAVLLHASAWLGIGVVTAVSAIEILARGNRDRSLAGRHDPLTGLITRQGLLAELEISIRAAIAGGVPSALLVIDLDRFTELNSGHGELTGDRVLRVVAARLRAATRPVDVVARLGGDEFAVLVPGVGDIEGLIDLARRLRASLSDVIDGTGPLFGPGASIGVALAPDHASSAAQLLERADLAMYAAKDTATGVRVYDQRTDLASAERLGLLASLRKALDDGELRLAYQPKVALSPEGDRLAGVEALLRWDDPGRGQVAPGYFIPLVEQSGLMGRLTTAVLELALEQVASWLQSGERIPVAVNVSLRDLEDPDFADRTSAGLLRAGVPGSLLTLEITERVLTGDLSAVIRSMERLQRIGVRMSLDDFGTGWSSLLLLRRLPVAEVKLDRAFVDGVDGDSADTAVVQAVVELSRRLNLTMVAEGVERPSTLARLRDIGCDVVQGYLLAEPLKATDVVRWARRHTPPRLRVVS